MSEERTAFNYNALCRPGTTTLEITQAIEKFIKQYPQAKIIEMVIIIETSQNDGFIDCYGPDYESDVRFRLVVE